MISATRAIIWIGLFLLFAEMAYGQSTVVGGLDVPFNLQLQDGNVYFSEHPTDTAFGAIKEVSASGGTASTLLTTKTGELVVNGSYLYGSYDSYTTGPIYRMPTSGGAVSNIAQPQGGSLIGIVGQNLYYGSGFQSIQQIPAEGGSSAAIADGVWVRSGAIDSTGIYFQDYYTTSIMKFDFATQSLSTLATGLPQNSEVAIDNKNVYIDNQNGIQMLPKSGGTLAPLVSGSGIGYSAYDSQYYAFGAYNGVVYYADGDKIKTISATGALNPTTVATITPGSVTHYIATDGTSVYWGDKPGGDGTGQIVKAVLPVPTLVVQQTTRQPDSILTTHHIPTGTELKVFSGGQFISGGTIDSSKPTIVLTHGWDPLASTNPFDSTNGWVAQIAPLLAAHGDANVVAWDWRSEASTLNVGLAASRTLAEGAGLGEALTAALGSNYQQSIHFFGHSLGTLVNAEATNVVHTHEPTAPIQDTLFDEAEVANSFNDAASGSQTYARPLPNSGTTKWIDNYVSSFGLLLPGATNVILQNNPADPAPSTANPAQYAAWLLTSFHGYPPTWYEKTIASPAPNLASVMGYRWAIENGGLDDGQYKTLSSFYKQSADIHDPELGLTSISPDEANQIIQQRDQQAAQVGVTFTLLRFEDAQRAVDAVGDVTAGTKQVTQGITNDFTPSFVLKKSSGASQQSASLHSTNASDTASPLTDGSAYAWLTVSIPDDAQQLSFDFTFHGLSPGDFLSFGINDTLLFQMESQFLDNDVAYNTGTIDVSQWAGQDAELFLGLNATDLANTGGTISIDNISFGSVPEPCALGLFCPSLLLLRRNR